MGKINETNFKSYSKPLEEQLEESWEAPLPEKDNNTGKAEEK